MSKKFVFLSDFSAEELPYGGGEINDRELVKILRERGHEVTESRTRDFGLKDMEKLSGNCFVVSNFASLKPEVISAMEKEKYVICEHDHKYLASRDPTRYREFKAPPEEIINRSFYKNAISVFCQTSFHAKILKSNLTIDNISSLGGNLWSKETLEDIRKLSKNKKSDFAVIMDSSIPHKNTQGAVNYCVDRGYKHRLIPKKQYREFLEDLSTGSTFIFFPKTPETCSRVVVEARMLGLGVMTNKWVGATYEDWFELKGEPLVDKMLEKREEIGDLIESAFDTPDNRIHHELKKEDFKISLITSLYDGDDHLEGFLENITSQTIFDKCELIIINADSPGNEEEVILKYQEKFPNIVYKRLEKDPGIYECWNIAIRMSTGDFISNANLDDRRSKQHLEILAKQLLKDKDVDLVYSECGLTEEENAVYGEKTIDRILMSSITDFSKENMIRCLPGPMPLWRKSMHDKAGLFDSSYRSAGDWEMWLRAVDSGSKFKRDGTILGIYYLNPKGISTAKETKKGTFSEEKGLFFNYRELFGEEVFAQYLGYFSK